MRRLIYIASVLALVGCGRTTLQQGSGNGSTGTVCTLSAAAGISAQISFGGGFTGTQFQVTARDGSYSETLTGFSMGTGTMSFSGAYERAGTYTVTVSYPGATSQTKSNIVVTAGECHVNGQSVSFAF